MKAKRITAFAIALCCSSTFISSFTTSATDNSNNIIQDQKLRYVMSELGIENPTDYISAFRTRMRNGTTYNPSDFVDICDGGFSAGCIDADDANMVLQFVNGQIDYLYDYNDLDATGDYIVDISDSFAYLDCYLYCMMNPGISFTPATHGQSRDITTDDLQRSYWKYTLATQQKTTYVLTASTVSGMDSTRGIVSGVENGNFHLSDDSRLIRCSGSGFIVSNHVIATNAHCIYNAETDTFGLGGNVTVFTFSNDTPTPHNLTVVSLHVPMLYRKQKTDGNYSADSNYDYGLIEVQEDLSQYGSFDLGVPVTGIATERDTGNNMGKEITVAGFPQAEINTPNHYRECPVYSSGHLYSMDDHRVNHTADSLPGSSGSPIYATTYGQNTVIGIHNSGGANYNGGIRLTQPLLLFYRNNPYVS